MNPSLLLKLPLLSATCQRPRARLSSLAAAFAFALALHSLIEAGSGGTSSGAMPSGSDLYEAILNTSFVGASGPVHFRQGPPGALYRGDRVGVSYSVLNYRPAGSGASSFAELGQWSFVSPSAGWSDRFVGSAGALPIAWATPDGSRPDVQAEEGYVRLGE